MTPEQIDRVFGRGRLQMVTGAHVEVFREAAAPGESRRYTKRFLTTADGDYAQWTEREWRILARLIGHGTRCVPDVVQYDRGAHGTKLVQTYDAGATVDQWATLLPLRRDGRVYGHAFEDCAHWWALAHHCLVALDEIHALQLVHLDIKGDNICIPVGPADFNPAVPEQQMFPVFRKLALIDFAFSLVSGETLTTPLPIGWQKDYDYQSPRLLRALESGRAGDLQPTEDLDWRCDMYSLAAMLKRYLPTESDLGRSPLGFGWTDERYDAAQSLILRMRDAHDDDLSSRRPHAALIAQTSAVLRTNELMQSLERGWTLARDAAAPAMPALAPTPLTRLAPPIRLVIPPRDDVLASRTRLPGRTTSTAMPSAAPRTKLPSLAVAASVAAIVGIVPFIADPMPLFGRTMQLIADGGRATSAALRELVQPRAQSDASDASSARQPAPSPDAIAANEPADEVAGSAQTSAAPRDGAVSSTPPHVPHDVDRSPAIGQSESTTTPAADEARESRPQSTPTRAPRSQSLASQIEAYRTKPLPRSASSSRATVSSAPLTARAANARPKEQPRRELVARAGKSQRPASAASNVTARAQLSPASKRAESTSVVASAPPVPARTPPIPVVARAAPATGTTVAKTPTPLPDTNAMAAAKTAATVAATAPKTSTAIPNSAPSPQASADVRIEPPAPPTPAVTFAIAPPVEAPRPITVPDAVNPALAPAPGSVASNAPLPSIRGAAPAASDRYRAGAVVSEMRDDADYLDRARRTLAEVVPHTSTQVHAQIARVLWAAANAHHPAQERAVFDAVMSTLIAIDVPVVTDEIARRDARRLHEEARQAYWSRRHVPEALDLELKAFGANPKDAEIAANLAFLHLRVVPQQPERARQLALHAIGVRSAQAPTGRGEDWTTFAIASALTGRTTDARNALFSSLALTRNLDRSCRTALNVLATYGDRLREPVESLLHRLNAQGRLDDSPYCGWPPSRVAGSRYQ